MNRCSRTLVCCLALAAAGCGGAPASQTSRAPHPGEAIYRADACSGCHGASGQGGLTAPPLRDLARHWDEASLVAFLRDPHARTETDPRLRELSARHHVSMPPAQTTSDAKLKELARYLLQL